MTKLLPQDVRLRRATHEDVDAIATLIRTHFEHIDPVSNLHKLIDTEGSYLFCVDNPDGDIPLACVGVSFCQIHAQKVAHILPFVVASTHQNQGIGRVLLSAIHTFASRHAKSRGTQCLMLSLPSQRAPHDFCPTGLSDHDGFYLYQKSL